MPCLSPCVDDLLQPAISCPAMPCPALPKDASSTRLTLHQTVTMPHPPPLMSCLFWRTSPFPITGTGRPAGRQAAKGPVLGVSPP